MKYKKEHPCYKRWKGMKERCNNPNHKNYADYGGRGIKVFEEWDNSSDVFLDWCDNNGFKDGLVLDRIDNDKGYSPENCRFIEHWRNCTNQRLRKNNTVGVTGVSIHKDKYRARFSFNKKRYDLGIFETVKEAENAIKDYKKQLRIR